MKKHHILKNMCWCKDKPVARVRGKALPNTEPQKEELDMIDKLIDEHLGMRPNDWPEEFKAFKSQILAEILKVIGEDEKQQWIEDYNMCNTCDFEIMDGSKDCLCFYRNKLKAELRTKFKELFNIKEK